MVVGINDPFKKTMVLLEEDDELLTHQHLPWSELIDRQTTHYSSLRMKKPDIVIPRIKQVS